MPAIIFLCALWVGIFQLSLCVPALGQGVIIERYQKAPLAKALSKTLQNNNTVAERLFNKALEPLNTPDKALELFREAGNLELAEAQYNAGLLLSMGKNNKTKDEAMKWYQKAAESGFAPAQINLGILFMTGEIVPKNIEKGINWLLEATETNYAMALYNLAVAYEEMADMEDNENLVNVDHIDQKNNIKPIYQAYAFIWYKKAALKGHHQSMLDLGIMYATGFGTETDPLLAYVWINLYIGVLCSRDRLLCRFNKVLWKGPVHLQYKHIYDLRIRMERLLKKDGIQQGQYLAARIAYENPYIHQMLN
ncbi:MAG: Secretory immunoglobulin A-binding protein EsiB [Alphaproteobacteria bacterium MarineAlpha3_Bin5]|nr:hypothetical protein [Magnetovibrio sp.]PPR79366.1 MAG: Secretory immunoglobulin A-binding protein EsiB [Alphaproteobacteria bacterium MarineAlpha3_Bin5]|tara:strand:+ start:904 stop:1827 length:924 start_codon:yes stop_codon:yes gene_type:complete